MLGFSISLFFFWKVHAILIYDFLQNFGMYNRISFVLLVLIGIWSLHEPSRDAE